MYRGVSALVTADASATWPTTLALITESTIHRELGNEPEYTSVIEYAYEVDGQPFTGINVYPGDSTTSSYRLRMVGRYPKGSTQTVHHHPNQPSTAFLETGVHQHTFIKFLFGSIIFTIGAAFGVTFHLSRKYPEYATAHGHNFPLAHPISKLILGFLLLIAAQFVLIFYFHR